MSKHTHGCLTLFQVGDHLEFLCPATEDGESILTITHEDNTAFAVVLSDMTARRLVACWNALLDAPTELLEQAVSAGITDVSMGNLFSSRLKLQNQRDELLAALKDMLPGAEAMGWNTDKSRAAIAKVEGDPK